MEILKKKPVKKRIEYFDILKGLGMILLIWGHTCILPYYIPAYFCTFYMSLFFFCSGYFFKVRSWKQQMIVITKSLIIPYLTTTMMFGVLVVVLEIRGGVSDLSIIIFDVINNIILVGRMLPRFSGPMWFVYCLIVIMLLFRVLCQINNTKIQMLAIFILSVVGYGLSLHMDKGYFPCRFITVMEALPVFAAGYWFKTYPSNCIVHFFNNLNLKQWFLFLFSHMVLSYIHYFLYGDTISFASDIYNNFFLFYINGLLGTVIWMNFCKKLECAKNGILGKVKDGLMYIGKSTLPLLMTHLFVINGYLKIFKVFVGDVPKGNDLVNVLLATVICTLTIVTCEIGAQIVKKTPLRIFLWGGR